VLADPTEALDISAILPENVEVLQDCLQAFAERSDIHQSAQTSDHPRRRLRRSRRPRRRFEELGYLED
jgi:hypothetical protein